MRTTPNHDAIARRAYEYWLARGRPEGEPLTDWLAAEAELRAAAERKVDDEADFGPTPREVEDDTPMTLADPEETARGSERGEASGDGKLPAPHQR